MVITGANPKIQYSLGLQSSDLFSRKVQVYRYLSGSLPDYVNSYGSSVLQHMKSISKTSTYCILNDLLHQKECNMPSTWYSL